MRSKAKHIYKKRKKEIRYLMVGGWNTVFGYFAFVGLYYLLSAYISSMLIIILTNVIAVTNNYIGYKFIVFKTKGNYVREYLKFYSVYIIGLLVNMGGFYLAVDVYRQNAYVTQAVITFIIIVMSYIANNYFAFSDKKTS